MQKLNNVNNIKKNSKYLQLTTKATTIALLTIGVGISGCQSVKGLISKDKPKMVLAAEQTDAGYYQSGTQDLKLGHYIKATESLNNLRTFYPSSPYAAQALLDLMYIKFNTGDYLEAVADAESFIRLHPSNPKIDYAYYVRGISNMQSSTSKFNISKANLAERDTSAYRLGFSNLLEFISKYPDSVYAPDAAKRLTFIYNKLAESELNTARWYIKRDAYLAAANRAKWVFQYFPQSTSVPEAIATLAYSNDKLGLDDLSNQYKQLLQINYPKWLNANGDVKLSTNSASSWLSKVSFGKLGRPTEDKEDIYTSNYKDQTRTQLIQDARQLRLPNKS